MSHFEGKLKSLYFENTDTNTDMDMNTDTDMNTDRHRVFLGIQSEYGKIRTRKTPNTDTFHAVSSNHGSTETLKSLSEFKNTIELWEPVRCPCRICKTYIPQIGSVYWCNFYILFLSFIAWSIRSLLGFLAGRFSVSKQFSQIFGKFNCDSLETVPLRESSLWGIRWGFWSDFYLVILSGIG